MNKYIFQGIIFITMGFLGISCDSLHKFKGEHHSLAEELRKISVDSINYKFDARDIYKGNSLILAYTSDSIHNFYLPERTSEITSFPCLSCHTEPLEDLKNKQENGKQAHWDIKINHAENNVMGCITCHDQNSMDGLTAINKGKITYNESFKLCLQCHSTQYNDWLGGAHGKSLGGWVEPRIMNNCVNCHDPHSPAFEPRWPARLNTIKLKEQTSN
ncbi:MAG: hypothetical protein OEW75_08785 [Cyclobacteriaceae bacterium]|nr:hypothetical protein [Cyclobacteriaceae bacterium]